MFKKKKKSNVNLSCNITIVCKILLLILAVFENFRNIVHNSETEVRVQYMIEVMFAIRKDGFKVSKC